MTKIKLKRLAIHNFMSFKDEDWDFSNTSKLVLVKGINKDTSTEDSNSTSNGSGKSSLVNALMFALYGQLSGSGSGKVHCANLKNKYSDEAKDGFKMFVDIEVDTCYGSKDVKHWRIRRGIQKGFNAVALQLLVPDEDDGWKDISKSTSANTQKYIEDNVLLMDFEMYQRLVMLSIDDKFNFYKLNASQKRDFVESLFDTAVYSNMYKMMGDDIKGSTMLIQNLKTSQIKLGKTKEMCESEIEKYKAGVNDRISETQKDMDEKNAQIEGFEPKFQQIEEQKNAISEALKTIRENKKKLDSVIKVCNDRITDATIDINGCNSTISHHQREINKHKEVLGMICEDCKKVVSKFYSLDVYQKEIDELNSQIEDDNKKIDNAHKQVETIKCYSDELGNKETEQIHKYNDVSVNERNLQFQKTSLLNAIKSLERTISDLQDSITNKNKIPSYSIYEQTLKDLDEAEKELKAESLRLMLLKVGSEIVSPESIRKNIISKVVDSINAMINKNLEELCVNMTCTISNDMNDYTIMSEGGELDFQNLSFGERAKLIISTQLAFRKFFISRFNVCFGVMLIDEVVDRGLDSVSSQKLLGMLLQLSQKEGTRISIISHRSEVETMFNEIEDTQMLVIQKENNISRILR